VGDRAGWERTLLCGGGVALATLLLATCGR
jgi:hypothetical protein